MAWNHQEEFNSYGFLEWIVNNEEAGEIKNYRNFTFLRIYGAGHMVPKDKPEIAYRMISDFLSKGYLI